ncbi:MAG: hypothetical protein L0G85_00195 [Kocuria sp.]|nr:hypothetical protein [Kocuria sp.]
MTKQILKNIDELEAQRRELDQQIRAAKRAKKKAAAAALMSALQTLGVDLAGAAGADNIESVELLREALMSDQMQAWLRHQIGTESSDVPVPGMGLAEAIDSTGGGGHYDRV